MLPPPEPEPAAMPGLADPYGSSARQEEEREGRYRRRSGQPGRQDLNPRLSYRVGSGVDAVLATALPPDFVH